MEFIVENEKSGVRLDKYLAEKILGLSRVKIQTTIKDGLVKINGHVATKSSQKLNDGDRVQIPEEKIALPAENIPIIPDPTIPLDIVYEDEDILVVNKPAGLLTHPTLTIHSGTLVNALLARYPDLESVGENHFRPGIVHRLDKDTSGLIVVAKNQNAFLFLKEQFLSKKIKKTYLAIVEGVPPRTEGEIIYDIRPSKTNRLKKIAVKKINAPVKRSQRVAKTLYKIIQNFNGFSLVEAQPLTGRTHQIRVHLSAIGCPIAGDSLYGSKSTIAKRQMLHAQKIQFTIPKGTELILEAELPQDFKETLMKLQK